MRKTLLIFTTVTIIVSIFILFVNRQTVPTITYFPIHGSITFNKAHTLISASQSDTPNTYVIDWDVFSQVRVPSYLRQDISLLYENGYLLGMANQWKTDTKTIQLKQQFNRHINKRFQSITFHYGEIHEQDDSIKSIQKMTYDQLYVLHCQTCHETLNFKQSDNRQEKIAQIKTDQQITDQLDQSWKQLIDYFNINEQDYISIPLTQLALYDDLALPNLTLTETQKVIGQLWEGLYKNYVIPLSETKQSTKKDYMPLVLIDQQADHLIVVYKINGQPEKLIQKISN